MRQEILQSIYHTFNQWSDQPEVACQKGCSHCCSQNVTITALEGELILRHVVAKGLAPRLAEKLASQTDHQSPRLTSNDFAAACLEGREVDSEDLYGPSICPFLENDLCSIYSVRPFGCRLFVSTQTCSKQQPAQMPNLYFEASTAVSQLIEHLGQKEYWGNMLDVLPAMLDISEFKEIADHLNSTLIIQARLRTLTAKPLPGFLISAEHQEQISSLLQQIFDTEINNQRVEDILNGR